MKPQELSSVLRRMAAAIENSKNPSRKLVAKELSRVISRVATHDPVQDCLEWIDESISSCRELLRNDPKIIEGLEKLSFHDLLRGYFLVDHASSHPLHEIVFQVFKPAFIHTGSFEDDRVGCLERALKELLSVKGQIVNDPEKYFRIRGIDANMRTIDDDPDTLSAQDIVFTPMGDYVESGGLEGFQSNMKLICQSILAICKDFSKNRQKGWEGYTNKEYMKKSNFVCDIGNHIQKLRDYDSLQEKQNYEGVRPEAIKKIDRYIRDIEDCRDFLSRNFPRAFEPEERWDAHIDYIVEACKDLCDFLDDSESIWQDMQVSKSPAGATPEDLQRLRDRKQYMS